MNLSLGFFMPEREYIEFELRSVELQRAHEAGGRAQGAGVPPTLVDRVWPPGVDSFANIFYKLQKYSP